MSEKMIRDAGNKSRASFDYITRKGIGSQVTVKEIAEVAGWVGGAAPAWIRRAEERGFLERDALTYTIVRVLSSEEIEFQKMSLFQKLLELRKEEERLVAEIQEILTERPELPKE